MTKNEEVLLEEVEKIHQEILLLTQRVAKLEKKLLVEQVKIIPKNNVDSANLDKIIESANIAMERLNKRMNRES